MHISALPQTKNQSPEEIRINDYLVAYSTSGRPPAPVSQGPVDERERAALGLPPLFQPIELLASTGEVISSTPINPISLAAASGTAQLETVTDPSILPKVHAFDPLAGADGETYCSISAQQQLRFFSYEELRYYAYAAGMIFPPPRPTNETVSPLSEPSPPLSPVVHPFFAKDGMATAFYHEPDSGQTVATLYYQTISTAKRFNKHCLEELRIAFLQAGRELDSSQIIPTPTLGFAPPAAPPSPSIQTLFGSAAGGAFAHSPAVQQF